MRNNVIAEFWKWHWNNRIELEKMLKMNVYLRNFVLMQPRTSPLKNLQNFANFARSSLFNAILFVVSERFAVMRHEDRRAMLHEGAGQQALTAFVPIFGKIGNFGKISLVFGCIGPDFCKKLRVLQHFSKSTRFPS